jgi:hypothetical protein
VKQRQLYTTNFANDEHREFNDDIGKTAVAGMMAAIPDEWKANALDSSLKYAGVSHFHKPGIVYSVDVIVAVPNHK